MNIFTHLTGNRFELLIIYFSESKENIKIATSHTYKSSIAFINGKNIFPPLAPSPVSTVFLTSLLMLSFLLPCQVITYILALSSSASALIVYPLLLTITFIMVLTMRSVVTGKLWPVIIYKYVYIIDVIFLLILITSCFYNERSYLAIIIINIGSIVWARILINSHSFCRLQKYYLHRRLSKLILKNSLEKKHKKQAEI